MARSRLGIIASHGGSNLQAILDAGESGQLSARPCVVISNNGNFFALARARQAGIPAYHLSSWTHPQPEVLDAALLQTLLQHEADIVVLAGYMKKLGTKVLQHFKGRICEYPSGPPPQVRRPRPLGRYVHEAVLAAGEPVTGVTIHGYCRL